MHSVYPAVFVIAAFLHGTGAVEDARADTIPLYLVCDLFVEDCLGVEVEAGQDDKDGE